MWIHLVKLVGGFSSSFFLELLSERLSAQIVVDTDGSELRVIVFGSRVLLSPPRREIS